MLKKILCKFLSLAAHMLTNVCQQMPVIFADVTDTVLLLSFQAAVTSKSSPVTVKYTCTCTNVTRIDIFARNR